jgi:hypothetical protein
MTSKEKSISTIFILGTINRILKKFCDKDAYLSHFDKTLIANFFKNSIEHDFDDELKEIIKSSGLYGFRIGL